MVKSIFKRWLVSFEYWFDKFECYIPLNARAGILCLSVVNTMGAESRVQLFVISIIIKLTMQYNHAETDTIIIIQFQHKNKMITNANFVLLNYIYVEILIPTWKNIIFYSLFLVGSLSAPSIQEQHFCRFLTWIFATTCWHLCSGISLSTFKD